MKVLINAYACSPNMGSEPGMAWNWCVNLAKYCELYIITEGEFRDNIELVVPTLPKGKNMHFYYNPIGGDDASKCEKIRKMCWNQGDWRFYWFYHQWQKKTLAIAREICEREQIDIIHQLNMIGFREPGLLWKIKGPKYVWGPIGGLINIPSNYLWSISKKEVIKNVLKKSISALQIRYSYAVRQAVVRADVLIGATNEETETIRRLYKKNIIQVNETGSSALADEKKHIFSHNEDFNLIWVGRFIPTKQLGLALFSLAMTGNDKIKLHIVGGTVEEESGFKQKAQELGIERSCVWHEKVNHDTVQQLMQQSDLFFFTSIAEATSTVILEAISNKLPILCFDTCGFGSVVDESIGIKISLSNPSQSAKNFAEQINYLYDHREVLVQMSENCKKRAEELSWENKAKQMVELYEKAVKGE